jgi:hypothetical protein
MTKQISQDPEVQPNPQVFSCGCVLTCYEDDEQEPPLNKIAELITCRSTCYLVSGSLEYADRTGKHAEVREDLP